MPYINSILIKQPQRQAQRRQPNKSFFSLRSLFRIVSTGSIHSLHIAHQLIFSTSLFSHGSPEITKYAPFISHTPAPAFIKSPVRIIPRYTAERIIMIILKKYTEWSFSAAAVLTAKPFFFFFP